MLHCWCVWRGNDSRCLWLLLLLLVVGIVRQGATYSNTGGNACYAEFGMTDSNGNGMRLQPCCMTEQESTAVGMRGPVCLRHDQ